MIIHRLFLTCIGLFFAPRIARRLSGLLAMVNKKGRKLPPPPFPCRSHYAFKAWAGTLASVPSSPNGEDLMNSSQLATRVLPSSSFNACRAASSLSAAPRTADAIAPLGRCTLPSLATLQPKKEPTGMLIPVEVVNSTTSTFFLSLPTLWVETVAPVRVNSIPDGMGLQTPFVRASTLAPLPPKAAMTSTAVLAASNTTPVSVFCTLITRGFARLICWRLLAHYAEPHLRVEMVFYDNVSTKCKPTAKGFSVAVLCFAPLV